MVRYLYLSTTVYNLTDINRIRVDVAVASSTVAYEYVYVCICEGNKNMMFQKR